MIIADIVKILGRGGVGVKTFIMLVTKPNQLFDFLTELAAVDFLYFLQGILNLLPFELGGAILLFPQVKVTGRNFGSQG